MRQKTEMNTNTQLEEVSTREAFLNRLKKFRDKELARMKGKIRIKLDSRTWIYIKPGTEEKAVVYQTETLPKNLAA